MSTGLMAGYDFDPKVDGIVIGGVPYVCINAPGRPQIGGPQPEGTKRFGSAMLIAPEANVKMATKRDGISRFLRAEPQPVEDISL